MDIQVQNSVIPIDYTAVRNDTVPDTESISAIDRESLNTNFNSPYDLSRHASDSVEILSDAKAFQTRQVTRNEINLENERTEKTENHVVMVIDNANDDKVTSFRISNIDQEKIATIEEYRSCKQEIQEVYNYYSPSTKMDTFPHCSEIHEEDVKPSCSLNYIVYTDRLIYAKESLLAVEVFPCQRDNVACFEYLQEGSNIFHSRYDKNQDHMLVYSYVKTNAASIFYSDCWPQDTFDLKTLLKPSIRVIDYVARDIAANVQLYHRCINNYYVRVPKAGYAPMTFYRNDKTMVSSAKHISYNNDDLLDLIYAPTHQLKNENDVTGHRRHRSSLLLLEPLLLMPELTSSEYRTNMKNRILRSERVKIIRIIITYVLSFLVLASITFYIVYFT